MSSYFTLNVTVGYRGVVLPAYDKPSDLGCCTFWSYSKVGTVWKF